MKADLKKRIIVANLVFIFVFLNIWDFALGGEIFNAMVLAIFIFGPVVVLWHINKLWSQAILTLVSSLEFLGLLVFTLEGFEISGSAISGKTIYFTPFLLMAGVNMIWGLKKYSFFKVRLN